MSILILTNIILASVETELFFLNHNVSTSVTDSLRIINLIISFLLVIMVIIEYNLKIRIS